MKFYLHYRSTAMESGKTNEISQLKETQSKVVLRICEASYCEWNGRN